MSYFLGMFSNLNLNVDINQETFGVSVYNESHCVNYITKRNNISETDNGCNTKKKQKTLPYIPKRLK
jgi:hypothetical protein